MHTPAPWAFVEQGEANEYGLKTKDGKWLIAFRANGEYWKGEQLANAQLIAIAPEMRDLLANLVSAYDARNITLFNQLMNQAREIATNHQPKGANIKSTQ